MMHGTMNVKEAIVVCKRESSKKMDTTPSYETLVHTYQESTTSLLRM
jgi:hypothetical protein